MASLTLKAGAKALEKTAKVKFGEPRQLGGMPVEHCKFNAVPIVPGSSACGTSW